MDNDTRRALAEANLQNSETFLSHVQILASIEEQLKVIREWIAAEMAANEERSKHLVIISELSTFALDLDRRLTEIEERLNS